jgi:hypothetical protein
MEEKWTFNSLATALMDIPAVSMPIVRSLKTWDICDIVFYDKISHFKAAFYSPSTRSSCFISLLICHNCQVDWLFWQRINAHLKGCEQLCAQHLRELSFLFIWIIKDLFQPRNMGPTLYILCLCSVASLWQVRWISVVCFPTLFSDLHGCLQGWSVSLVAVLFTLCCWEAADH